MSSNPPLMAVGMDLGGTAIKTGIVDSNGRVVAFRTTDTQADKGPDHILSRMAESVAAVLSESGNHIKNMKAIGLGLPGPIDRDRGIAIDSPNLPGWKNVPIVERLSRSTGLKVIIDNDANNAAWGEFICGAGKGLRHMVLLTLGTGIGGGIVLNNHIWHGATGNAAEIGHTIVERDGRLCGCGQRGCLEAYASATSIVARVSELIQSGRSTILAQNGPPSARDVVAAASKGDPLAQQIWSETCYYLAVACINIHHTLEPQRIVFSGGMSAAGDMLIREVTAIVARLRSGMIGRPPEIHLAKLGNDAGFIGSALNVFESAIP